MHNPIGAVTVLVAFFGIAVLPTTSKSADPEYVNHYDATLPTISVQELKQKLDAFNKAEETNAADFRAHATVKDSPDRTVIPAIAPQPRAETSSAPLVADMNSPEFTQRLASGDPAALQALSKLSAQTRAWAGTGIISPPSVQQGVTNSQMQAAIQRNSAAGNPAAAAALGNSLAMSTNPGAGAAIARADEERRRSAPTFPLLVQEAEIAVHFLTETGRHDVTSVTINSGYAGGAINVVDANGKYAVRVVSLDSLAGFNTNPTGVPTPSNVGVQAAYTNVMSNGPTNSVTLPPNARVPEGYQKDPITGEITKSDLPDNLDQQKPLRK